MTTPPTYRASEAAKQLFISASHLRTLTREGRIASSHQTPGGQHLYTAADLVAARRVLDGSDVSEIAEALAKARLQLAWPLMGHAPIITVHSSSLGSSQQIAVDLALQIRAARTIRHGRVLVVDGAMGYDRLAHFALGREPDRCLGEHNLIDLVNERDEPSAPPRPIMDFVLEGGRFIEGIDMLLGPSDPRFAQDMTTDEYLQLLHDCREHYQAVIVAAGAVDPHSPHGRVWLATDHVLIVDDLSPNSLSELNAAVQLATTDPAPGKIHAAARRCSSGLREDALDQISLARKTKLSLIGELRANNVNGAPADQLLAAQLLVRMLTDQDSQEDAAAS